MNCKLIQQIMYFRVKPDSKELVVKRVMLECPDQAESLEFLELQDHPDLLQM